MFGKYYAVAICILNIVYWNSILFEGVISMVYFCHRNSERVDNFRLYHDERNLCLDDMIYRLFYSSMLN